MLRHIVLFKLKPFDNEEDKLRQLNLIKSELEIEVASIEELPKYAEHPEHIRVASQYIKPYVEKRACVDFTI